MERQTIIVSVLLVLVGLATLAKPQSVGNVTHAAELQEKKAVNKPNTRGSIALAQGDYSRHERETIVQAATTAVQKSVQADVRKHDTDNIPTKFWGEGIRKLRPLQVVNDRMNIKIVLMEDNRQESGLYVSNPISSYLVINTRLATYELLSKPEDKSFGSLSRYHIRKKHP